MVDECEWSRIKNVVRNTILVTYIIYIFSYAFDLVVSYTIFNHDETAFVIGEMSDELVQFFLHEYIPYTFISQFVLGISLPSIFYYWFKRRKNMKILYPLILSLFFLIMMATLHFRGGSSWWI